jgi:DGQHR domain-containing protein
MNNSDIVSSILTTEKPEKETLHQMLAPYLVNNDQIFVQKTQMGGTQSFIGSVTLEWFATRVMFASKLPLLHSQFNSHTENVFINAETIEKIQQRPLDWSRQAGLTQYLATRKYHKFPPVLVVINQDWVNNSEAKEWDENGRAFRGSAEFLPLDQEGKLGLLNVSTDVKIFALDGQHRLMGVQGLMELIKTGRLPRYKKDKKPLETVIKLEDLRSLYHLDYNHLQSLLQEKIGIEFISSVVAGETYSEARKRIRSIFVHVNLMAVPLTKGQLAQLDENNGFSIVARNVAVTHPLLTEKTNENERINWDSATVKAKSQVLTTLQALAEMSEKYLQYKYPYWKPLAQKGLIPVCPQDDELATGIKYFYQLCDYLNKLPSYQRLEEEETPRLRRFSFEKDGGEGNMLFRPVGQIALVHAVGIMVFKKGVNLEVIFEKLQRYDQEGGFSNIDLPKSIFYGILYDVNQRRILVSGKDLATKVLVYLLGGIEDEIERAEIRRKVAEARTMERQAMGFDGNFVEPKKVGLPPILAY